ncbi:MAG: ASCH domain-containing protein [Rhodospirillales bacterium]|nr:ASCH domain-containing protein [Rhodospirillales bacterium]
MRTIDTPEINVFWQDACTALEINIDSPHIACAFAEATSPDRVSAIDAIGELSLSNQKRGTAHLELQFKTDGIPMRNIGDYWIVLKCDGSPICVVKIIALDIVPFNQVGPVFAASEGEGDLSLDYWRNVHGRYFKAQCERWGKEWRDDFSVVCESFITVYRPDASV